MGRDGRDYPQPSIVGPEGNRLTRDDLPSPITNRWTPRRKAQVVSAVRGGLLSLDDACVRYALTVEEFLVWQQHLDRYGLTGLRARQMQEHRHEI
jgi:hypothetical protein